MSETITPPKQLTVTLQLLDPSHSYATQTWAFNGRPVLRIGRSDNNDIVIAQAIVSRAHAELNWCDDHWELVSLGRHGTLVQGETIQRVAVADGTVFQLGLAGPALRLIVAPEPKEDTSETITAYYTSLKKVDEMEKARQVAEITDSNYFQNLQRTARKLRGEKEAGGG